MLRSSWSFCIFGQIGGRTLLVWLVLWLAGLSATRTDPLPYGPAKFVASSTSQLQREQTSRSGRELKNLQRRKLRWPILSFLVLSPITTRISQPGGIIQQFEDPDTSASRRADSNGLTEFCFGTNRWMWYGREKGGLGMKTSKL